MLIRLRTGMPDFRSLGEWAVITGSTDGIGKSYALEMAKCGMGVVLISRNQAKLDNVRKEIRAVVGASAKVKTVAMDFTESRSSVEILKSQLEEIEVGVLINNVGMGYPKENQSRFLELDMDYYRQMLDCNVDSMIFMCQAVLPQMLKRKKGLILNVGSYSSDADAAFLAVYTGTKAFVESFSACLAQEYAASGIVVACVKPGVVVTKFIDNAQSENAVNPGPDTFVKSHLKVVDIIPLTHGFWAHDLLAYGTAVMKMCFPILVQLGGYLTLTLFAHESQKARALQQQKKGK